MEKEKIKGYEARHAWYCRPPKDIGFDLHLVKEVIHMEDGTTRPNVRLIRDWKRPFWVTKKGRRVHQQKREIEYFENLDRFESTQSRLIYRAAKALGTPWFRGSQRDLSASPYLYGVDINSEALLKGEYKKKFPELMTESSVSVFDIETSMEDGSILCATLSFKDKVYTAVRRDWIGDKVTVEDLARVADRYLDKYKADRNITWQFDIVNNELEIVTGFAKVAHEWKPDFIAIWNIDFDLPKVISVLEDYNVDPKHVFSDPSVPEPFRFFKYVQGPKNRTTASGKVIPINYADQWHTVRTPASFYFIDAMCAYRKLRVQKGELPGYGLDYVLNRELGERKLKFDLGKELTQEQWHIEMQKNHKLEYVAYNIFDCIGVELLDEKTKDLSVDIPVTCTYSDFAAFDSQPKRVADEMHHWIQEEFGAVIGTTGPEMILDSFKHILGTEGWIVNLKAYLITDEGLRIFGDYPNIRSRFYVKNYDSDVAAAYPSNTIVFNICKETQKFILCRIEDVDEHTLRMCGINLSGGYTNGSDIASSLYKLPRTVDLVRLYAKDQNKEMPFKQEYVMPAVVV